MPADSLTKKVGILKEHMGIADKAPETIALEDAALELYRSRGYGPGRSPSTPGPRPLGGMSYEAIGAQLDRSGKWAEKAIASAKRREAAAERGTIPKFDGSVLALRKFTSSELLDAGFNISVVAGRQGHGAQVLVKHYSKRPSGDRKAAEHLGRVVRGSGWQCVRHPRRRATSRTELGAHADANDRWSG